MSHELGKNEKHSAIVSDKAKKKLHNLIAVSEKELLTVTNCHTNTKVASHDDSCSKENEKPASLRWLVTVQANRLFL